MMHNGPSGVLSSCDLRLASRLPNNGDSSMVKQSQTHLHSYHQHSDLSSRSSSVCSSSSLSPKTSSPPAAPSSSAAVASVPPNTDIDPQLAQHVEYELGLTKKNGTGSGTRKNAWGNLSYAELISKAITSSAGQRLTLAEIYDWMIKYVPFFRNKVDRTSSAGWKNSIRHNLSLHNRFKRVQSEGTGKSSWWIINPDEKIIGSNGSSSSAPGVKQPRRRHGPSSKSPGTSAAPKRLRAARSTKGARALTQRLQQQQQQQSSSSFSAPSIVPIKISTSVYDAPQWKAQSETDGSVNQLYEAELYATSVNTPTTNSSGNSIGCLPSNYVYDDPSTSNYVGNSSSTNPNSGDYAYHHGQHHFHHHLHQSSHPPTLYQHHLGSTYELGSTNSYYLPHSQGSVLTDHPPNPCSLSIDTYHPNASGSSYSLAQQQDIDPTDEHQQHLFLRVHSISSQSSNASLSPPINANLVASSSSGGYLHPNSNGTLTLYSHHHLQPQAQQHQHQQQQQHLGHHPHADIESLLHLNADLDELDDDDDEDDDADLSTFVHHHHHHGVINEHLSVPSFYSHPVNPHHSHHDGSAASILRTVLKRPIVGENVRLSSASSNNSPL